MLTTATDLSDPELWSRDDLPALIDDLRGESAVHRTPTADDGPVWSVLSYDLAAQVLRDTATYSSRSGSLLGTGVGKVPAGSGRMMALSDPPLHRELRAPASPFFSPGRVRDTSPDIVALAGRIFADAVRQRTVDLVEVVSQLPLAVMCDLLGIPDSDRAMVVRVCDEAFLAPTPDRRRAGHQQLIPYLLQQVILRRADPGDDLVSAVATHRVGGRLLPFEDVVLNLDNILVGGAQTVRHTATMSLLALVQRPELWQRLRDGAVEVETAVEELLRWTSVGLHTLRTATRDVLLDRWRIRAGDRVAVWLWAANHDPAVFDRPHEIVLDRTPNRHLALGLGAHYCIGGPLAKAELGALFSAALRHVAVIEPTAPPQYHRSVINFGLDRYPVRLVPR
ncbi:cytochrome P450 [Streptomyces sp. NPDC047000]|uniref:cytochrome P450 n=1 Tax=Streptomyces sp. NPDC047000 TaxID=3155474 RepID=UPI0033CDC143